MLFARRQISQGRVRIVLRPLTGFERLEGQVGQAIESGRRLHISLGRATLVGAAATTSIAVTKFLTYLSKDSCANNTPPLVTVGDGTLLPLAEHQIREAYEAAGRSYQYRPETAQFVAQDRDAFAYAGGVSSELQQNPVLSNVLAGHFGPELALMAESANRQQVQQVIASDDPSALAIGMAATDHLIVGEEMFAAGAYLEKHPGQLAALQVQDIARWVIAVFLVAYALFEFFL